jgi:hypothetical protein
VNAMTDPWTDRLSEYLDDALSPDERTLADAHVSTCDACRGALSDLTTIAARARTLPAIAPAADLWPGIAARVAVLAQDVAASAQDLPRARRAVPVRRGLFAGGGITMSWPQLAAAGIALMLLSGGAVWYANRAPNGAGRGTLATNGTPGATGSLAATHPDVDPGYAAEVADLERVLAANREKLGPETVKTIESNLRIIDLATAQARQALAADPANPYLKDYLSKTMKKKVELLKQATVFATAQ